MKNITGLNRNILSENTQSVVYESLESTTIRVFNLHTAKNELTLKEAVLLGYIEKKTRQIEGAISKVAEVDYRILPFILGWTSKCCKETAKSIVSKGYVFEKTKPSETVVNYSFNKMSGILYHISGGTVVPIKLLREKEFGGIGLENGYVLTIVLQTAIEIGNSNLGSCAAYFGMFSDEDVRLMEKCLPVLHKWGLVSYEKYQNKEFEMEKQIRIDGFMVKMFFERLDRFLGNLMLFESTTRAEVISKAAEYRREVGFEISSKERREEREFIRKMMKARNG